MISNLQFQLSQIGMADRLGATVQEVERVRAELGYPIMVTPLAQFIGSQAALNVITGRRYETVTDEIIRYALGQWGAEAVEVMDPSVREKVLDRPRAAQLTVRHDSEPTLEEVRERFSGSVTDEELITCVMSAQEPCRGTSGRLLTPILTTGTTRTPTVR